MLVQLGARFAMRRISVDLAISVGGCLVSNSPKVATVRRTIVRTRPCCDDDNKEQSSSTELIGGATLP